MKKNQEKTIIFCNLKSTITKLIIEQKKLNSKNIKIANALFFEGAFKIYAL